MTLQEQWKWKKLRELFVDIAAGICCFGCQADASYTAGVLRLLADELDPEHKGDPRAVEYIRTVKEFKGFDD